MSEQDVIALLDGARVWFESTTVSYPTWLHNVKAGKYKPADGSETPWGLGFAAIAASQAGLAPVVPPVTPPTALQRPYGVLRLGGSLAGAGDLTRYGMACGDAADGDKVGALHATTKALIYMDGTDVTTWFDGVDQAEAKQNGWLLEPEGSNPSTWLADVGSLAYQNAFAREVIAFLTAHKLDGCYTDDCIVSLDGYYGSPWPTKYPTPQAWYTAMQSFILNVGHQIKAAGFYFGANAVAYFQGNRGVFAGTNSDDGSAEAQWIKMLAPGLSFVMVENWMWANNGHLRSTAAEWDDFFDGWQALVRVAQDAGIDFVPTADIGAGGQKAAVYTQAAYLLDKDDGRVGGTLVNGGAGDPFSTSWAKPVGAARGPKTKTGNVWMRIFADGTGGDVIVKVDPVACTASIT